MQRTAAFGAGQRQGQIPQSIILFHLTRAQRVSQKNSHLTWIVWSGSKFARLSARRVFLLSYFGGLLTCGENVPGAL